MKPVKISVNKEKKILDVKWNDDKNTSIKLSELRKSCPCAECVTEQMHRPANYIPLMSSVSFAIKDIKQIGTYAIQIYWQDGHESGIYPFALLRKLGDESKVN